MNLIVTNFIFPRLHYLFYATLFLMAGISCRFLALPYTAPLALAISLSVIGLWQRWQKGFWQPLFFIASSGLLLGFLLCFLQLQDQQKFQTLVAGPSICLRGTISSIEKIQNPRFNVRMILEVDQLQKEDQWIPCGQTIALYVNSRPDLLVADRIEITNVIFKPISNTSFTTYLAKEKICATLFLESLNYKFLERPNFSLNRSLFYFKESLFKSLRSKINYETFQLFSSIFLGNRVAVKKQMDTTKEPFKIWGTSHYLARSGLHLVIFVIVWHFLLSLLPLTYLFKQLFLLLLILVYALLSWSSVSFERALLMVLIYKCCLLAKSPSHYIHLIVLVTLLVLIMNPLQLFFLDFQLSFGLTFALAWFNYIEARKKQAS